MRILLQGALILVCTSCLLIVTTLAVGSLREVDIVTIYQEYNYQSAAQVMDAQRNLSLNLAGKRCFRTLPTWEWEETILLGYSPNSQVFIFDNDASLTVERLSCSRIRSGTLLKREVPK